MCFLVFCKYFFSYFLFFSQLYLTYCLGIQTIYLTERKETLAEGQPEQTIKQVSVFSVCLCVFCLSHLLLTASKNNNKPVTVYVFTCPLFPLLHCLQFHLYIPHSVFFFARFLFCFVTCSPSSLIPLAGFTVLYNCHGYFVTCFVMFLCFVVSLFSLSCFVFPLC